MVDSATIQSQAKVFDLGTTAFLTNCENGLSNFRPCLEWPATVLPEEVAGQSVREYTLERKMTRGTSSMSCVARRQCL